MAQCASSETPHAVGAAAAAAASNNSAAVRFLTTHSELYREQLSGDPAATVEGCFPPLPELPEARVWKLLGVLTSLYAELAVVSKDELHIFRVRDRPFYESLRDCSEVDLADMKTVVDYLLLPKPLLEAMEIHVKVEGYKQAYQAALASFDVTVAEEPRPTLLPFLRKERCLLPMIQAAFQRIGRGSYRYTRTSFFGEIMLSYTIFGLIAHDNYGELIPTARQAIFDGLMGEPISEYGYPPSPLRLQINAAMCVVMERPIPWSDFSPLSGYTDWLSSSVPHVLSPIRAAAVFNRLPAFDDILAHGIDIGEAWGPVVDAAVTCGNVEALEEIKTAAPLAFDLSTEEAVKRFLRTLDSASHRRHLAAAIRWVLRNCEVEALISSSKENATALLGYAAAADDLDLAQRFLAAGCTMCSAVTDAACLHGNREITRWALDHGAGWGGYALGRATQTHDMGFVFWALEHGCPLPEGSYGFPRDLLRAVGADVTALELLMSRGLQQTPDAITCLAVEAASMGRLDVLQWAKSRPSSSITDVKSGAFDWVLVAAIQAEQFACVEWMMSFLGEIKPVDDSGQPRQLSSVGKSTSPPFSWAACATRDVLERLVPYYDLSNIHGYSLYARDLELARWLLARGFHPTSCDVREACVSGLDAVPFLRLYVEDGSVDLRQEICTIVGPLKTLSVCALVARGGSVAMMEYVRSRGCEWDDSVLSHAANYGQLPMLRWLRAQDPAWPWPEELVKKARECSAYETAAWAEEHGATS